MILCSYFSLVSRPLRIFQCCTLKNWEGLVDFHNLTWDGVCFSACHIEKYGETWIRGYSYLTLYRESIAHSAAFDSLVSMAASRCHARTYSTCTYTMRMRAARIHVTYSRSLPTFARYMQGMQLFFIIKSKIDHTSKHIFIIS